MSSKADTKTPSNLGVSNEDKNLAKSKLAEAFSLAGLAREGNLVCPNCGTHKRNKVVFKISQKTTIPYWKCYKCGERGDAIGILQKTYGLNFVQAVNELVGKTKTLKSKTKIPAALAGVSSSSVSVVDVEVYNKIQSYGSVDRAAEYYGTWHIDPSVVRKSGAVYLENCSAVHDSLLKEFGRERLLACGVVVVDKKGNDFFLFNDDYPVLEPHTAPNGNILGMQFRPSFNRMIKVKEHKKWKERWTGITNASGDILEPSKAYSVAYGKDPLAAGEKVPYITPFLSLKGAGPDSLVGCGLHLVAKLEESTTIYIVEGFKDMLAAYTMGGHAYAIPGVGVMPPAKVCSILSKHSVVIALDADKAGEEGSVRLHEWLSSHGVTSTIKRNPRNGMDITDILVERHAHSNCLCETCTDWRESRTKPSANCPCLTCKNK